MKKFTSNTFIFIFMFIFIYSPRLISKYDPIIILTIISLINLLVFYGKNMINLLKNEKILKFFIGIVVTIMYLLIVSISTSYKFTTVYRVILIVLSLFPCSLYICFYMKKHNYTFKKLCDLLIKVSFFQSIISILMFVNSNFRQIILDRLVANGLFSVVLERNTFEFMISRRIYGITTGFTFSMPVFQGFIAVLALLMGIKYSARYFLYIPFILFSASINARTGLLVFIVISLISIIIFKENKTKKYKKSIIIAIVIVVGFNIFTTFMFNNSESTYNWINAAKEETIDFILGKEEVGNNTYRVIIDMLFLPEGKELIFGTGSDVYLTNYTMYSSITSDIGYVNDIFIGGLIFVFIFYGTIIKFGLSGLDKNSFEKVISIIMVLTLLLVNIKGSVISKNDFFNGYILISVAMIVFTNRETSINLKSRINCDKDII